MRVLKEFEDYVKEMIARKVSVDNERAKSLIKESERKMNSLKEKIDKIGIKDENANDYVEYCYDIIMLLIRAKLYSEGYSTGGHGAHEAEVSYLRNLGFNEREIQFTDQMRYFRNRMLYYGTAFDKEYAKQVIEFTEKMYSKLKKILKTVN